MIQYFNRAIGEADDQTTARSTGISPFTPQGSTQGSKAITATHGLLIGLSESLQSPRKMTTAASSGILT